MHLAIPSGPPQALFEALLKDFERYAVVARGVLRADPFAILPPDCADEVLAELARRSPNTMVECAMAVSVGDAAGATETVMTSMTTFREQSPEWFMGTPSRKRFCQLRYTAGGGSGSWRNVDESTRAWADRATETERRALGRTWVRTILDAGRQLPPDDQDAGLAQEAPGLEHVRYAKAHPQHMARGSISGDDPQSSA
jgi:hypothetical protein